MPETDDHTLLVRLDQKVENLIISFDEFRRERMKSFDDRLEQVERKVWMFAGGLIVINAIIVAAGRLFTH